MTKHNPGLNKVVALAVGLLCLPTSAEADGSYEELVKKSQLLYKVKPMLLPFVATCDRERTRFRKLFCTALNERLKAQHQAKIYHTEYKPAEAGPLVVTFKAKPKPTMEIEVMGCLTCKKPMLPRRQRDISKGRFFMFKVPEKIAIRRGKIPYDFGDISVARYSAALPEKMTAKAFKQEVLPHIRLDLFYRPVAGTTMVKSGRYSYGVINFELVGHRVVHKCTGKVYGVQPPMSKQFLVDKNDLSCPQNQPKKVVVKPKLPSTMPQRVVKGLMELVGRDLQACYEQFGVSGRVPTDIVVAPTGKVRHVKVVGKLAGSPTGSCVERLVSNITFPKFSGDDARLQWPFTLQE